ncbi:hypothetical protein TcG_05944 [Trypanosoma cruzi]|nr:hypothetical protein TcG_05944 [Trypanosoma cruzi]
MRRRCVFCNLFSSGPDGDIRSCPSGLYDATLLQLHLLRGIGKNGCAEHHDLFTVPFHFCILRETMSMFCFYFCVLRCCCFFAGGCNGRHATFLCPSFCYSAVGAPSLWLRASCRGRWSKYFSIGNACAGFFVRMCGKELFMGIFLVVASRLRSYWSGARAGGRLSLRQLA